MEAARIFFLFSSCSRLLFISLSWCGDLGKAQSGRGDPVGTAGGVWTLSLTWRRWRWWWRNGEKIIRDRLVRRVAVGEAANGLDFWGEAYRVGTEAAAVATARRIGDRQFQEGGRGSRKPGRRG
jgi:hypothetical protein